MVIKDIYDDLDDIKDRVKKIVDQQKSTIQQREEAKKRQAKLNRDVLAAKKARIVIQHVAMTTQNNLKYHIANLCTNGMHSINPTWPEFIANFETRRNKTELDLLFEEKGVQQQPKASSGFGPVDIATLCLRFSIWTLNKNRPFFVLDEPFKHLSKNHSDSASKMLRLMCDRLGLQVLMVSHDDNIVNFANKNFLCKKSGDISKVTVMDADGKKINKPKRTTGRRRTK